VLVSGLRPAARRLALLAALIALPPALGLTRAAQPAVAIVSCQGTFTTAGETPCPAGAGTLTITAIGGAGGGSGFFTAAGGNADSVQATFDIPAGGVGPGGTLYVEVGGAGGTAFNALAQPVASTAVEMEETRQSPRAAAVVAAALRMFERCPTQRR
jgi:hypothetical protein